MSNVRQPKNIRDVIDIRLRAKEALTLKDTDLFPVKIDAQRKIDQDRMVSWATIKLEVGAGGAGGTVDITMANLAILVNTNELVPGQWYYITDRQLYVEAISESAFAQVGYVERVMGVSHVYGCSWYTNQSLVTKVAITREGAEEVLYTGYGTNDWYLPSQDEMSAIYTNIYLEGLGDFDNTWYWTSSETDAINAVALDLDTGNVNPTDKTQTILYRPVRHFESTDIYALGDRGEGNGFIFYDEDLGGGDHRYYEVYPTPYGTTFAWTDAGANLIGTTGTIVGTGYTNSLAIIGQIGHTTSAANECLTIATDSTAEVIAAINALLNTGVVAKGNDKAIYLQIEESSTYAALDFIELVTNTSKQAEIGHNLLITLGNDTFTDETHIVHIEYLNNNFRIWKEIAPQRNIELNVTNGFIINNGYNWLDTFNWAVTYRWNNVEIVDLNVDANSIFALTSLYNCKFSYVTMIGALITEALGQYVYDTTITSLVIQNVLVSANIANSTISANLSCTTYGTGTSLTITNSVLSSSMFNDMYQVHIGSSKCDYLTISTGSNAYITNSIIYNCNITNMTNTITLTMCNFTNTDVDACSTTKMVNVVSYDSNLDNNVIMTISFSNIYECEITDNTGQIDITYSTLNKASITGNEILEISHSTLDNTTMTSNSLPIYIEYSHAFLCSLLNNSNAADGGFYISEFIGKISANTKVLDEVSCSGIGNLLAIPTMDNISIYINSTTEGGSISFYTVLPSNTTKIIGYLPYVNTKILTKSYKLSEVTNVPGCLLDVGDSVDGEYIYSDLDLDTVSDTSLKEICSPALDYPTDGMITITTSDTVTTGSIKLRFEY